MQRITISHLYTKNNGTDNYNLKFLVTQPFSYVILFFDTTADCCSNSMLSLPPKLKFKCEYLACTNTDPDTHITFTIESV